jgi:8-oxo-dGTP pyrophosphatase MutT (NUDIX family)
MKYSAQVVLINEEGLVLGVSRKDNHNSMGLPGGKMEDEDMGNIQITATRETKEETGLDVRNLQMIFATHKHGFMSYTYLGQYSGEINHNEPHVVKWVPMQVLINGSFGKYNELVAESLTDMGVEFQGIDEEKLWEELNEYVTTTVRKGYEIPFTRCNIHKHSNHYILSLLMGHYEPDEDWSEFDSRFDDGIYAIGARYGVNIRIPSHYYTK